MISQFRVPTPETGEGERGKEESSPMAEEAEEAEVLAEVEAVRSVYGDDCHVLRHLPPHLTVHMRPRTADVSSQQFVEAAIGIEAGPKYPVDVPCIKIIDSKGLDERRQGHLISSIKAKAQELSSCFMLVALCEEAVEILSNMNHPAGNCPLCLDPLFPEDKEDTALPFMKLMSCFHCFHSQCIIGWWKWLQKQHKNNLDNDIGYSGVQRIEKAQVGGIYANQQLANCPVCRQMFDSKDIEHVLSFMETNPPPISEGGMAPDEMKEFLESVEEKRRRHKIEALLEIQKRKGGLIEPQKIKAIVPGMYLPEPATQPQPTSSASTSHQIKDATATAAPIGAPSETTTMKSGIAAHGNNVDPRRNRGRHHHHRHHHQTHRRKERTTQSSCQWVQKENSSISRQ